MKTVRFLIGVVVVLTAVGCGEKVSSTDPTLESSLEAVPTSTPIPTEIPTATAIPGIAVLWAPPDADALLVEAIQDDLSQSAAEAGLFFQVHQTLTLEFIQSQNVQWIIALAPAPGLTDLVISTPEVRYLAIGIDGLVAGPNLSVIAKEREEIDQQGFIAGYMAAVITQDWRIGVISVADSEAGQLARRSFITGAKFYCGFCSPTYPPFYEYPLYVQLNGAADAFEWQAAADILIQSGVETIYIVPGAGDENLIRYLANSGIRLISSFYPPDEIKDSWVATLGYQPLDAFYEFWPDFVAGVNGQLVSIPLSVNEVNHNWISPGQLRLVEEMLAEVQSGYIQLVGDNIP